MACKLTFKAKRIAEDRIRDFIFLFFARRNYKKFLLKKVHYSENFEPRLNHHNGFVIFILDFGLCDELKTALKSKFKLEDIILEGE